MWQFTQMSHHGRPFVRFATIPGEGHETLGIVRPTSYTRPITLRINTPIPAMMQPTTKPRSMSST